MKWIYHQRIARVIFSLTTDRQPVIYWATNQVLARFYFDSSTQETTKRQVYPSDVSSFLLLQEMKSRQNVDCIKGIYMYFVSF